MGKLDDLSITEFTQVALSYYLDIDENEINSLISLILDGDLNEEDIERDYVLDNLEVYNYLKYKTNDFDPKSIWIALRQMEDVYCDFLDLLDSYDKDINDFECDCFEWYYVSLSLLEDEYEKKRGHLPIISGEQVTQRLQADNTKVASLPPELNPPRGESFA